MTKSTTTRQKIELTVLIHNATKQAGLTLLPEHKFHPTRRWRADFAIPELRILIEYEGINSAKSGHTTITGYTSNCEKYNQAAILGWRVLRYTFKNYSQFIADWASLTTPAAKD